MKFLLSLFLMLAGFSNVNAGAVELPANFLKMKGDSSSPYALIAGGSKGIGYSIAEALAKRNYNLILIARNEDSLVAAKNRLEAAYGIHIEILVKDLAFETTAAEIAKWCTDRNIPLKMLCNVAGLGGEHDYLSLPLDSLRYMVRLNLESVMALTLTLLPLLEKNAPSYIMNVASMAGFSPIPIKNVYAATKSAVVSFSYSLRYQLKEKNISVSCLAPGPVFTKPSIKKYTKEKLGSLGMSMAVPVKKVGEVAVKKNIKGKNDHCSRHAGKSIIRSCTFFSTALGNLVLLPHNKVKKQNNTSLMKIRSGICFAHI